MKTAALATLVLLCLSRCTTSAQQPTQDNRPEQISVLERKGYEFNWEADHWEAPNMAGDSVFFYYPDGLGELPAGFGYSASIDFYDAEMRNARRDFFLAFDVDDETQIWMLQLAESILTDGETGGRSCHGSVCCMFLYNNPEYRFYCTPN